MKWLSLMLCLLAWPALAQPVFEPETPYLFEHFDPQQTPWQPGRDMNIEEVFKNYEYYEIVFGRDGKSVRVTPIRQGRRLAGSRYIRRDDGGLQADPAVEQKP